MIERRVSCHYAFDAMERMRHAIAQHLRAPLRQIHSKLSAGGDTPISAAGLVEASQEAIAGIDALIGVFEKLLQIAEAESGMRIDLFTSQNLNRIVQDMVQLSLASAAEKRITLKDMTHGVVFANCDRDLLASAVVNLINNAIGRAGAGGTVEVEALSDGESAAIIVRDDGAALAQDQLQRMTEKLYQLGQSRNATDERFGLSVVAAIATLHGGRLRLESGARGLIASIVLPLE